MAGGVFHKGAAEESSPDQEAGRSHIVGDVSILKAPPLPPTPPNPIFIFLIFQIPGSNFEI